MDIQVTEAEIEEAIEDLMRVHTRRIPCIEVSSKSGINVEQLITLALETISPTFFLHSQYEGPTPDMFRSMRQIGMILSVSFS